MKKNSFFSVLLFFTLSNAWAQSIFDNPITGTNPNTSNPYTIGQTVNPNITVSGIGRGTGITGSNTNNRYNASQWTTNAAIDLNDYFEFTLTPNPGISIGFTSFVYTGQASASGPASFAFRSSLDGYTTDIGTATVAGATIDLSSATYQNISAPISFRFYGWAALTSTGTFSINDFTFNGVTGVLPIRLEYFTGVKHNNNNILTWKVDCINSSKVIMDIERSKDGSRFNTIKNITADALRCLQPFEYTDEVLLAGYNYYRLRMTDADGKITYSNKIVLLNSKSDLDISVAFPSIVKNNTTLQISAAQKMQLTIVITDCTGRTVQKRSCSLIAGNNSVQFDLSKLAPGVYQVTGYTAGERTEPIRFIKQ
jgi:hypothetical protein